MADREVKSCTTRFWERMETVGGPAAGPYGIAREVIAEGLAIRVASVDDIIESKRAADREKDRRALPYLESLSDILKAGDS